MKYDGFLVVYFFALFLDLLNIILDFDLLLPPLEGVRVQKFAIESAHLLCILEQLGVGLGELLLLDFLLELALLLVDASALELLLLELFVPLFFLALLEVLEVVGPLVRPLLALLEQVCRPVLFCVGCVEA